MGDSALYSLARRQGFVISSAQLAGLGVSRQRARTLVRRGVWSAPAIGVLAPLDVRSPDTHLGARRWAALAASAAALRRRDEVVSGRSAAILHGLPVYRTPVRPELTTLQSARLGRRGTAHVHGAAVTASEMTRWFGVAVLTVDRTLVDLGRHDRRDAIMAADAALRAGIVTRAALDAAIRGARGWPGVRQARAVLELADPLAESPLESLTRLALIDDKFPAPQLQAAIPGTPYRVDMLWSAARLVLEADGLAKYTVSELRREKRRETRLRALGYRVERVTWEEVVHRWPQTRVWLRRALQLPGQAG
jgi:very-short-patch-repair endonuclease